MSDQCTFVRNILSMFMMCSAALELIKLQVEIFEEEDEEIIDVNLVELSAIVANSLKSVKRRLLQEEVLEPRKRAYIKWDYERAQIAIEADYWGPSPRFRDRQFERIFRISKTAAERVLQLAGEGDTFFRQQTDGLGRKGICPVAKLLMGLKCLAYGTSASAFVDYFQMGESTGRLCVKRLVAVITNNADLRQDFFRTMNRADAKKCSNLHLERHGVEGMVGSLDCMHVFWKNCPVAWQGSHVGKDGKPSLVLEAYCDANLFLWHACFGWAGSMNDINIWDRSPLLKSFLDGSWSTNIDFLFNVDGSEFTSLWFLVDGIYPELARFVKTLDQPLTVADTIYTVWQESSRKDIERAFGVLQRKFHYICRPVEGWFVDEIKKSVEACIMLHNMMVVERVERDEQEGVGWYEVQDSLTEEEEVNPTDQALEDHNRLEAEAYVRQRLRHSFYSGNQEVEVITRDNATELQHVANRRWDRLYDTDTHFDLRNAIRRQVASNNRLT
jgi:hypothetical protein